MGIDIVDVLDTLAGLNPALNCVLSQIVDEIMTQRRELNETKERLSVIEREKADLTDELNKMEDDLYMLGQELQDANHTIEAHTIEEAEEVKAHVTAHCEYCPGVDKPHGPDAETEEFVDGLNRAMVEEHEVREDHVACPVCGPCDECSDEAIGETPDTDTQKTLAEYYEDRNHNGNE